MLNVFDFKGNEIRFVDGKPVANDVAQILGYADPASTVSKKVKPKYKGVAKMETPGGIQSVTVLEEGGIYQLILGSRLPIAEEFQDWLFEDALPTIRKTGQYSVKSFSPALSTHEVAVQKARAIAEIEDLLANQPRLAQFLIDHTISDLMEQKRLTGQSLRGVVEIAESMGLPVNINNRCLLGKFVKNQLPHLAQKEERLVNGTLRQVSCYPDSDEVRNTIKLFFES